MKSAKVVEVLSIALLLAAASACESEDEQTVECHQTGIVAEKGTITHFVSCTSLCGRCFSLASDGLGCHDDADHPYCVCNDGSFVTMCWTDGSSGEVCGTQTCD